MRRRELLNHLRAYGCRFVREGGNHSIWENPSLERRTAVPRHREIPEYTARRICIQLGIPQPYQARYTMFDDCHHGLHTRRDCSAARCRDSTNVSQTRQDRGGGDEPGNRQYSSAALRCSRIRGWLTPSTAAIGRVSPQFRSRI